MIYDHEAFQQAINQAETDQLELEDTYYNDNEEEDLDETGRGFNTDNG